MSIQDKFLIDFSRKLGHLPHSKILKLNIEHTEMLKCASLAKMVNNFRNLNLSTIILKMKSIKCENTQISEFLAAFKYFPSFLENLVLNLHLHGEWDNLKNLTEVIKCLQNLKYLDLTFNLGLVHVGPTVRGANKRSKRPLKALVRGLNLKDAPEKTQIKFEFSRDQFTLRDSRSAMAFIQKIAATDFRFLSEITFNDQKSIHFVHKFCLESVKGSSPKLPVTFNLNDAQEIPNFVAFFKPLQHIYSLYISIEWKANFKMNEIWIQQLSTNFAQLSSISSLAFGMRKCHTLDPVHLEKFCSCFSSLQPVDELCFDFTECIQITDACLSSLGNMLMKMTSLKKLSVIFDGCYLIQNEGIEALSSKLLTMKSLEYVKVNCDGCWNLDPKESGVLLDLANSVSKSEIRVNKFLIR